MSINPADYKSYIRYPRTLPTTGQVLSWDGRQPQWTATTAGFTQTYFSAYDHTGGITIGASATDLTYDTEVKKDTEYTHSVGVAGVTVITGGFYLVQADIDLNTSAGSTNSNTALWVAKNGTEIPGMRANLYTFQSGAKCSCTITRIISLAANDVIKVQGQLSGAGNTVATVADGCRLSIVRVAAAAASTAPSADFSNPSNSMYIFLLMPGDA